MNQWLQCCATTTMSVIGQHQGHPPIPPSTRPKGHGAAHKSVVLISQCPTACMATTSTVQQCQAAVMRTACDKAMMKDDIKFTGWGQNFGIAKSCDTKPSFLCCKRATMCNSTPWPLQPTVSTMCDDAQWYTVATADCQQCQWCATMMACGNTTMTTMTMTCNSHMLRAVRIRTVLVTQTCDGRPKQSQAGGNCRK